MEYLGKLLFGVGGAVLLYAAYMAVKLSDNVQNNAEHIFIPAIALFAAAAAAELIWGDRA